MTKQFRHIASRAAFMLLVVLALCAGLFASASLFGCSDEPAKDQSPAASAPAGSDSADSDSADSGKSKSSSESANKTDSSPTKSAASSNKTGSSPTKSAAPSAASSDKSAASSAASPTKPAKNLPFTCTFLNVGQGDCAIVQCDGHYMIVDGGNPQASSAVYTYVQKNQIKKFDYLIATHDDADHIGGLSGALQLASVKTAFSSVTSSDKDAFQSLTKYLANYSVKIQRPKIGKTFKLGKARVQVIAPAKTDTKDNDDSLVLRITYKSTSILLTGDASELEEDEMLQSGYTLKSDLLKVAHHGSASSSSARFLRAVSPTAAVISVGKDNTYGHPTSEALSRLDDCGAKIYRTDLQGTITAASDGKTITVQTQKKAKTPTNVSQSDQNAANRESSNKGDEESEYIGNVNSKKFHRPNCRYLPLEKNRVIFKSRKDAVDAGYASCGVCHP